MKFVGKGETNQEAKIEEKSEGSGVESERRVEWICYIITSTVTLLRPWGKTTALPRWKSPERSLAFCRNEKKKKRKLRLKNLERKTKRSSLHECVSMSLCVLGVSSCTTYLFYVLVIINIWYLKKFSVRCQHQNPRFTHQETSCVCCDQMSGHLRSRIGKNMFAKRLMIGPELWNSSCERIPAFVTLQEHVQKVLDYEAASLFHTLFLVSHLPGISFSHVDRPNRFSFCTSRWRFRCEDCTRLLPTENEVFHIRS